MREIKQMDIGGRRNCLNKIIYIFFVGPEIMVFKLFLFYLL